MSVSLYKQYIVDGVRRSLTLQFPDRVVPSYCKTKTNSKLIRTPHGMVRVYETTKV